MWFLRRLNPVRLEWQSCKTCSCGPPPAKHITGMTHCSFPIVLRLPVRRMRNRVSHIFPVMRNHIAFILRATTNQHTFCTFLVKRYFCWTNTTLWNDIVCRDVRFVIKVHIRSTSQGWWWIISMATRWSNDSAAIGAWCSCRFGWRCRYTAIGLAAQGLRELVRYWRVPGIQSSSLWSPMVGTNTPSEYRINTDTGWVAVKHVASEFSKTASTTASGNWSFFPHYFLSLLMKLNNVRQTYPTWRHLLQTHFRFQSQMCLS